MKTTLENIKYFIFPFIITILLGYFLGIAIASTVDYRIQDAVIHMPKPRNNIKVLISKKNFNSKKPIKVDVKSNNKNIEQFLNYSEIKNKKKKNKSVNQYKKYNIRDKNLLKYSKNFNKAIKMKSNHKYSAYNKEQLKQDYMNIE